MRSVRRQSGPSRDDGRGNAPEEREQQAIESVEKSDAAADEQVAESGSGDDSGDDSDSDSDSDSDPEGSDTDPERPQLPPHPGQLRSLVRASHPRQALVFAVVIGALVALMGRPLREVALSAAAVFLVQLLLGLLNDLSDREDDAASLARGKPIASGWLPAGNASFVVAVLLLLAVPVSLQNGTQAGVFLLATVPVGYVHNRWLHRSWLSWLGWVATFVLLTFFVTLGGWGPTTEGTMPMTSFVVLSGALGFFVHFLTSLPDLVQDNRAGVRNLPLRIALKTGATKLLVVSVLGALVVLGLLVYYALTVGIAR